MSANAVPSPVRSQRPREERIDGPDKLTTREKDVLVLIADGYSTKDIAGQLEISFKTAACHRSRILAKLGVHNTAALVRRAIRLELVQP